MAKGNTQDCRIDLQIFLTLPKHLQPKQQVYTKLETGQKTGGPKVQLAIIFENKSELLVKISHLVPSQGGAKQTFNRDLITQYFCFC